MAKIALPVSIALTLLLVFVLFPGVAQADGTVSLTTLGSAYTENFDTLASSGTSNTVPNGWWFDESGANANGLYTAGTGSSNTGDTYSYGATGATERAFGGLRSGSLIPWYRADFQNNTGSTITSLTISYYGEQWRLGVADAATRTTRPELLRFGLSVVLPYSWVNYASLDFSPPITTGTIGALDGNAAANRTLLSYTITGLSIAPGATFYLRWEDVDAAPGADDGMAIDDFSLTPYGAGSAPVAVNDSSLANPPGVAGPFSVTGNDTDADGNLAPSTVDLDPGTAGQQISRVVSGEGTWSVDASGNVTFTPQAGFAQDPTPISYTVSDATALVSNQATITVDYVPVATNDTSYGNWPGDPVTVDVLANDTTGDLVVPSTVQIAGTANPGDPLVVAGQGTWSVNTTTGAVTFTPEPGFLSDPTPISYTVQDNDGNTSNQADVTVTQLGAMQVKQEALSELESVLANLKNLTQRRLVGLAIMSLRGSLDPGLWVDANHLNEWTGTLVFAGERTAVSLLRTAIYAGANRDAIEKPVIAALVTADRLLAAQAIEDAANAGGCGWLIDMARCSLKKGDGYAASNKADYAIDAYRSAWRYAVSSYCGR
ncbi:MAG: hypothetical protein JXA87_06050 [Thermoleophilia bacterium]|nr:hypothetical protein [Thermoleophilia bacterium]